MREIYYPKNEALKNYVRYYLFYEAGDTKREFLVFPNPGSAIGLHKKHGFLKKEKNVYQVVDAGTDTQLLHINRIDPVKVIDEGQRETVTIVFHPLGINHFIREHLSDLIIANDNDASYIDISALTFSGFSSLVFESSTREAKITVIEEYLL